MNVFFHEIELEHIIAHRVGNKTKMDGLFFSPHELNLANGVKSLLYNYFLDSFKDLLPFYRFATYSMIPQILVALVMSDIDR